VLGLIHILKVAIYWYLRSFAQLDFNIK